MINEIDINKQYRTRNGREVRIYATDGGGTCSVHGAILKNGEWESTRWNKYGVDIYNSHYKDNLVEVKPRIKQTIWVNVYPESVSLKIMSVSWPSKERADNQAMSNRIACVKVEIDCEEGDGL